MSARGELLAFLLVAFPILFYRSLNDRNYILKKAQLSFYLLEIFLSVKYKIFKREPRGLKVHTIWHKAVTNCLQFAPGAYNLPR